MPIWQDLVYWFSLSCNFCELYLLCNSMVWMVLRWCKQIAYMYSRFMQDTCDEVFKQEHIPVCMRGPQCHCVRSDCFWLVSASFHTSVRLYASKDQNTMTERFLRVEPSMAIRKHRLVIDRWASWASHFPSFGILSCTWPVFSIRFVFCRLVKRCVNSVVLLRVECWKLFFLPFEKFCLYSIHYFLVCSDIVAFVGLASRICIHYNYLHVYVLFKPYRFALTTFLFPLKVVNCSFVANWSIDANEKYITIHFIFFVILFCTRILDPN